jgi:hypothetical protein
MRHSLGVGVRFEPANCAQALGSAWPAMRPVSRTRLRSLACRVRKFGRDQEAAPAAIGLTSFGPPLTTRTLWVVWSFVYLAVRNLFALVVLLARSDRSAPEAGAPAAGAAAAGVDRSFGAREPALGL